MSIPTVYNLQLKTVVFLHSIFILSQHFIFLRDNSNNLTTDARPNWLQPDKMERTEQSDREIQFGYSEVTGYFSENVFYIITKPRNAMNILKPNKEN